MAQTFYATLEYTATAGQTDFAVNFASGYLKKADVTATVNGVNRTFTWVSDGLIKLSTATAAGDTVVIQRNTTITSTVHEYTDGSTIIEENLDQSFLQTLLASQEASDNTDRALAVDPVAGTVDAESRRIINLADPVNAQDAVTKKHLDDSYNSGVDAGAAATAAAASAAAAATSETNAANSATASANSATAAATSETNAANSASAAATSETNAATSATASASSATASANSATASAASAAAAATSEANAATSEANAAASAASVDANQILHVAGSGLPNEAGSAAYESYETLKSGRKNFIINGNLQVWQRGTIFTTSGYTADRALASTGGSVTIQKHPISVNTLSVNTTAANSFANIYWPIETLDVVKLRGRTVTFSIDIIIGGTHAGEFVIGGAYSNTTDAAASVTTPITGGKTTINATTSKAKYQHTFTVPSDAVGLMVSIENPTTQSSGAIFDISEVQLEEGSVSTEFEYRPYAEELSNCQRYCEVINSYGAVDSSIFSLGTFTGTNSTYTSHYFKVEKRITPTVTITGTVQAVNGAQSAWYDVTVSSVGSTTKWARFENASGVGLTGNAGQVSSLRLTSNNIIISAEL